MTASQQAESGRDQTAAGPPPPSFRHATPALRTFCGPNAVRGLGKELARAGCSRAVVVTGASVRRHDDAFASVTDAIGDRLAGVFDAVAPHSPVPTVEAVRDLLAREDADAVVAVGGGSAVVTARAASILLAEGRDVRELCTRREADGRMSSPRLDAAKLPQWVVATTPTTAYAKAGSAVRDPDTGERLALFDPKTRAQGVFFDSALAMTAPVGLAEGSALNALAMAVEALQSTFDDPLAEALLMHAVRVLTDDLPRLRAAPEDAAPRLRLMTGALLAGQGTDFAGGGLAQAIAHAAGPMSTTSNGALEALLLPHTIRFNAPVTRPGVSRLAEAFLGSGAGAGPDAEDDVVGAVQDALRRSDVPTRLRDVGIDERRLPEIVEHATGDWFLSRAPRPAGEADLRALLQAAW